MDKLQPHDLREHDHSVKNEAYASGVSWGAVIGGAFVAAAISLILVALGTGLGFSSVSPWLNAGASGKTIGVAAIVWLILMQIISASLGGYLAGRLRTKWVNVHTDEVFFRDTAHGFLVWAVGLVMTASFLTSAATSMVGAGAQMGAAAVAGVARGAAAAGTSLALGNDAVSLGYLVDSLFRSERPRTGEDDAAARGEIGRIFATGLRKGNFVQSDRTYLAQMVAARTGLSQADAEQRVSDVIIQARTAETEARQAVDTARKAVAATSMWIFVALLIGAFCASYAATIGGRQRDHWAV